MSYALLWIEALLTSLLWVAALLACAARIKRRWASRMIVFYIGTIPFLVVFLGLCALAAMLKFSMLLRENWFAYTVSLLVAYLIGAMALVFAGRRAAPGLGRAAANWPRARLALGLLTIVAVASMTLWNMDLEVRAQAGNLRNEAGAIMLSISPPSVADSHNAALIYDKAFARLDADKTLVGPDSVMIQEAPDINSPAIVDLLKRHDPTIKLLHRAAAMPDCRFDHDYPHPGIGMMLPELHSSRTAAAVLSMHARSELSHGHIESAMTDLNAIFQLSKAVGSEPMLLSYLVSAGLEGIAINALQDVLPAVTKKDQLANLNIGDESYDSRLMVRSLQGEEAMGLAMFGDVARDRMNIVETMNMMRSTGSSPVYSQLIGPVSPVLVRVFLMADDMSAYRELMQGYQQAAAEPYYKRQAIPETSASLRRHGLMASLIAPAFSTVMFSGARAQAIHATAQAAIAMTRYRLDHGSYPTALDRLVPDYLDDVPLDPFDGKPLRLSRKDAEWVVYSIGPDAVDDGGAPYDYKSKKGDLLFILKTAK